MTGVSTFDKMRDPSEKTLGFMLLAPAFILLALIVVYPIGKLIFNSFFDLRLSGGAGAKFVGWENYALVLTDMRLPGADGLAVIREVNDIDPDIPVIMITGHGDVTLAVETMKQGAVDFLEKPFNEARIKSLIDQHMERARSLVENAKVDERLSRLYSKLTTRELQVLERIVAGRLNKQIADDLSISIKTVEAHRANIMEKLNANTVADLLKIALGQNAPKA